MMVFDIFFGKRLIAECKESHAHDHAFHRPAPERSPKLAKSLPQYPDHLGKKVEGYW